MDESKIRSEIAVAIYNLGFIWHHPPDMTPWFKNNKKDPTQKEQAKDKVKTPVNKREMGKIDLIFSNPVGPCILVESKDIIMSDGPEKGHNGILYFREISPAQRKTLDRWCFHLGGPGYLAIGTNETGRNERQAWLIHWCDWVREETLLFNEGFKGIPVYSKRGMGLTNIFETSKLKWVGGKEPWEIPDDHRIRLIKTNPHPENEWEPISIRFGDAGTSEMPGWKVDAETMDPPSFAFEQ